MPRSPGRTAGEPALETYRRKRDFRRTREPEGDRRSSRDRKAGEGGLYVVQKHHASRLHFDFRLEHRGVLLSWAVPKGPSLDPAVRRLAVRVEDHPLDYAKFEGTIPAGNYGAGKVAIWDRGRWTPEEPVTPALDRGRLDFDLRGGRLAGSWRLVRMNDGARDAAKNWLLVRRSDAGGGEVSPAQNGRARPAGRSRSTGATRAAARPARAPEAKLAPEGQLELATLVDSPPEGTAWLHETKWDGYRMLAVVAAGTCRVWSRSGLEWTARLKEIASPLARLPVRNAVIDGELIALSGRLSRFERLQAALGEDARPADRRALRFVAFDLLVLDGDDLRAQPLVERRKRLSRILAGREAGSPIRFSRAGRGSGARQLALACSRGEEGILSKLADSPYRAGRGRDWQKSRCHGRDELVIVGYTPGRSSGAGGLGALVLATRETPGGPLVAAGKVGTGFDAPTRAGLLRKLKTLETGRPQFEGGGEELRDARWVRPELVAEIRFTEWTRDGRLRHPAFLGLRADRSAAEVRRERPDSESPKASKGAGSARKTGETESTVAGVQISNPDRIVFPETTVSKLELARYFETVWPWIEPHLADRPLAFVRCPAGAGSTCFFQKHLDEALPGIAPVDVSLPSEKPDVQVRVESREGLVSLAQRGVIELHLWGSRSRHLERPDRLVFDLDPGDGVTWQEVVAAARLLHRLLGDLGLRSFALLSGGKGVHVVVPVGPAVSWDSFKAVAAEVASALERADPERFVARAAKKERAGRIFVDYLRNGRGATAIAPYSPRARAGAPVAMPIAWSELARSRPDRWTIRTALRRLASGGDDPWKGYFDPDSSFERAARAILGHTGEIEPSGKTGRKGMATRKSTSKKRYGKLAEKKVERAMHEMKRGQLKSGGSGKKVTSRKQAIAIGLSEAREAGGKVPPPPRKRATKKK